MNVPLLDLKAQYASIKAGIDQAVQEVFESQHFILGPKVAECEAAVARYSNCAFAVGVSSGTDALFRNSGLQVVTSQEYQAARWQNAALNKGGRCVVVPAIAGGRHIFNQFVIRVPRRDELKAWLKKAGIDTEIYYPLPLHLQECFRYLGHHKGDFPESERAAEETLALPVYPELSDAQAKHVVNSIAKFLNG
jgi:dTDP-4-amino-4,6-dideoxygalactose transaminase